MTNANEPRDTMKVSSATADSSAAIRLHTSRSRAFENRAGSVTVRVNQSAAAEDSPGSMKLATSFHLSQ